MIPFEDLGRANKPFEDSLRSAFERVLASGRYVVQAAFLRVKLERLPEIIGRKNETAARYDRELDPSYFRPRAVAGAENARSLYPVLHPRRDELRAFLASRGIATDIHYPVPPHRQQAISPLVAGDYPVSERLHRDILSIPLSFGTTDDEIGAVVAALNEFAKS